MAEAGELCHWEIVGVMAGEAGADDAKSLAEWAVPIQQRHVETVRRASLQLAKEEAAEAVA